MAVFILFTFDLSLKASVLFVSLSMRFFVDIPPSSTNKKKKLNQVYVEGKYLASAGDY